MIKISVNNEQDGTKTELLWSQFLSNITLQSTTPTDWLLWIHMESYVKNIYPGDTCIFFKT